MVIKYFKNFNDLSVAAWQAYWVSSIRAKEGILWSFQGGNGAPIACKDVLWRILYRSILLKVPFYQEQNKEAQKKPKERTRLTWAKPRVFNKQTHLQLCVTLFFRLTLLQPLCKKLLPASIAMITWPLLNCTKWLILLIVRLRLSASLKLL